MYEEPAPVKPPSNPSPSKPIFVPANPEHVGDNNANNVHTNEIAKSSYRVTDSLAMILKVFIVLAIVFLLVVAVFSFIKYKNRNKLRNNFYIMKTEQFMKSQK
jgi:cell division protein FtsL